MTPQRLSAGRLLTFADLAATLLFAVEGAIAATYHDLDLFGVAVVGFTVALVGGIVRDLLIGYTPPASLRTATYPLVAFGGVLLVLLLDRFITQIPMVILQVTDAAGLALFAVVGTTKALDFRLGGVVAPLLGTISAVGGGVVRDVLFNIVPQVLRQDIYAAAALAGGVTTVLVRSAGASRATSMVCGFLLCFVLRVLSFTFGWNLPRA